MRRGEIEKEEAEEMGWLELVRIYPSHPRSMTHLSILQD